MFRNVSSVHLGLQQQFKIKIKIVLLSYYLIYSSSLRERKKNKFTLKYKKMVMHIILHKTCTVTEKNKRLILAKHLTIFRFLYLQEYLR